MQKRIPCDWFLTDGILAPVRLDAPETVMAALRQAGVVEEPSGLMDELKTEWVYRRTWRYYAAFPGAESAAGRRCFLSADGLFGQWCFKLNGAMIAAGSESGFRAEVTGRTQAGENVAEFEFAPEDPAAVRPVSGFEGALVWKETGSARVCSLRLNRTAEGEWACQLETDAQEACEAVLRYSLAQPGGTSEREFHETLAPGAQSFVHAALDSVEKGVPATVSVRLFVNGELSDEASDSVWIPTDDEAPRGFAAADDFTVAASKAAGGNAVCCEDTPRMRLAAAENGLQLIPYESAFVRAPLCASETAETLLRMTDGDGAQLENDALWYFSLSDREGLTRTLARAEAGDAEPAEAASLSRYLQAEDLRRQAETARLKKEAFLLDGVRDAQETCASCAIFDADDTPRPAYLALTNAWKPEHVFAMPPEKFPEDGIVNIPVYCVADGKMNGITVNAVAFDLEGHELVSASFPAAGRTSGVAGRLCVEMPEDGVVVLRLRALRAEECVSRSDEAIAVSMEALRAIPETQLIDEGTKIVNAGSTAAVGVSIPGAGFYGVLLPGEEMVKTDARSTRVEGLNVYL